MWINSKKVFCDSKTSFTDIANHNNEVEAYSGNKEIKGKDGRIYKKVGSSFIKHPAIWRVGRFFKAVVYGIGGLFSNDSQKLSSRAWKEMKTGKEKYKSYYVAIESTKKDEIRLAQKAKEESVPLPVVSEEIAAEPPKLGKNEEKLPSDQKANEVSAPLPKVPVEVDALSQLPREMSKAILNRMSLEDLVKLLGRLKITKTSVDSSCLVKDIYEIINLSLKFIFDKLGLKDFEEIPVSIEANILHEKLDETSEKIKEALKKMRPSEIATILDDPKMNLNHVNIVLGYVVKNKGLNNFLWSFLTYSDNIRCKIIKAFNFALIKSMRAEVACFAEPAMLEREDFGVVYSTHSAVRIIDMYALCRVYGNDALANFLEQEYNIAILNLHNVL